eukprot:5727910-Pleurochrysis_carterae.AAC.1
MARLGHGRRFGARAQQCECQNSVKACVRVLVQMFVGVGMASVREHGSIRRSVVRVRRTRPRQVCKIVSNVGAFAPAAPPPSPRRDVRRGRARSTSPAHAAA